MVLTGAAYVHIGYLRMYTYAMDRRVRDMVTKVFNCEDIAMNFLIADYCQCQSAYLLKSKGIVRLGSKTGISARSGHLKKRHQCMDNFAKIYGRLPLRKKRIQIY